MKLGKGIDCGREGVKEISQRRRHLSRGMNEAEEPVLYCSVENSIPADRRARAKAVRWKCPT